MNHPLLTDEELAEFLKDLELSSPPKEPREGVDTLLEEVDKLTIPYEKFELPRLDHPPEPSKKESRFWPVFTSAVIFLVGFLVGYCIHLIIAQHILMNSIEHMHTEMSRFFEESRAEEEFSIFPEIFPEKEVIEPQEKIGHGHASYYP